ncbi:MAG: hypothetical protein OEZ19_11190, partial [Paracoccaceae bacterium]|nr:hypothetical protein [Paracoccaceae bacterium]
MKTRQVFYIPGYDPFPARRYRELYRKEALAQAKTSGYKIQVSPKANAAEGDYGWSVRCLTDGHHVSADVTVLNWTDLVRKSMRNSIPATYLLMLRTVWIFLSTGTFRRLMWLR